MKVLLKLGADVKDSTLLQDCGESDINNYSIDLVMIERNRINIELHREQEGFETEYIRKIKAYKRQQLIL